MPDLSFHPPRVLPGDPSRVWELHVVILICLYPDFLKELLLALGVSFQNGIRQLCCLTGSKTTPFQVGSTAWRGHAVGFSCRFSGLPGACSLTILFRFLHSLQYFCLSLYTWAGKQLPQGNPSAPPRLRRLTQPALPAHLLFLFWSHVVGGCFNILQSLSVASTLLLQLLDLFLHLRCGQGTS